MRCNGRARDANDDAPAPLCPASAKMVRCFSSVVYNDDGEVEPNVGVVGGQREWRRHRMMRFRRYGAVYASGVPITLDTRPIPNEDLHTVPTPRRSAQTMVASTRASSSDENPSPTRTRLPSKVTRSPNTCSPADVRRLHTEGLSDKDILCLVEIIAYQNMSTRIMESLSTVER